MIKGVTTTVPPSTTNELAAVAAAATMPTPTTTAPPPTTPTPMTTAPPVLVVGDGRCSNATHFVCANGECVSPLARCNQMRDCRDNSDERDCSCVDFLRAQFLTRKICDGVVDCWDYSDENLCGPLPHLSLSLALSLLASIG